MLNNISSDLSNTSNIDRKIYKIDFNKQNIDDFYRYYDNRNNGTYFLSSYKTANIYGLDKDYSTIVYASVINLNDILHPKSNIGHIYPLYYIAKKCFTIKLIWRLLDNNELFNIFNKSSYESSEKNIDKIIEKYKLTEEEIINFKYNLHYTCSYNDVINEEE